MTFYRDDNLPSTYNVQRYCENGTMVFVQTLFFVLACWCSRRYRKYVCNYYQDALADQIKLLIVLFYHHYYYYLCFALLLFYFIFGGHNEKFDFFF